MKGYGILYADRIQKLVRVSTVCIVFALSTQTTPQTPALTQRAAPPEVLPATFDVASIRPMIYDHTARTHIYNSPRDANFKAANVTLRALLEVAYNLPETQMFGGPAWTATDKFDLEAKSDLKVNEQMAALPSEEGKQTKRQMLRALLAERFKLAAHTETREMPIYALVTAKGGSKLVKSNVSGTTISTGKSRITIKGGDDSLALLTFELAWRLGRPVIDRTDRQAVMSSRSAGPTTMRAHRLPMVTVLPFSPQSRSSLD